MTYQQITIVGNVGREPELRYISSGTAVTDFSVAVTTRGKVGDTWQDVTTWYRVTCWGKLAETVAQYVQKGKQVLVVADRIEVQAYMRKDGQPGASIDITAQTVRFLGGRNDDMGGGYNAGDNDGPRAASGGYPEDNDFSPSSGGDASDDKDLPF